MVLTQTILPIKNANTSIMGKCRSTAHGLCKMQHTKLLTLCWRSFSDWGGVAVSIYTILPIKAANTSIMGKCLSTALGLCKMQHTKSLTLCWCSFSDWACDHVTIPFAHNGGQYVDSGYLPSLRPGIIHDATLKIIDTVLTLYWRCVDAYLTLCWCSFGGVAVSIHTIMPIKAANTSIMGKWCGTALELCKMQHTKSLTLCWRSFSDWACNHVTMSFAHNGGQYIDSGYML
jgi:hypothetical protein